MLHASIETTEVIEQRIAAISYDCSPERLVPGIEPSGLKDDLCLKVSRDEFRCKVYVWIVCDGLMMDLDVIEMRRTWHEAT